MASLWTYSHVLYAYLSEYKLSLVTALQLAMNMPIVEFSSVQISSGTASCSPGAKFPLALLYATTRRQSPVCTVSPSRRNTFTPVVVILLQYRSQANGHIIDLHLRHNRRRSFLLIFFFFLHRFLYLYLLSVVTVKIAIELKIVAIAIDLWSASVVITLVEF